ncbi:MAG TPA: type II secretion system F family protein [Candidatus Paceibacterota bacterium]|jgi:type IV pilus assembly protein PilC|nr:type II secretion system F family protein [Candidatus Paceibacterota bacterium]HOL54037.1 type II secretion system F family protein [Candidatus Paceibacterota bacterium]HPP16994.1 type II secretion system F family protein [Candidatus Paceibacterota bacterium]
MAKFRYTGRNDLGEIQSGVVEAGSRDLAIKILQDNKIYVLSLESLEKKGFLDRLLQSFQRVKTKDLMIFTRQLSVLLSAKVQLVDSLKALYNQVTDPLLKDAIFDVFTDVEGGMYFSQALAKHPKVFSDFFVNMVRSAELSGRLEETLNYLADYLEKDNNLKTKLRNAMIYPAFIIVVFLAVMILVVTVVIPQLKGIFTESGSQLPFITRVLMSVGDFLLNWGVAIIVFLVIAIFLFVRYIRTPEGKAFWQQLLLSLPIIGPIQKKVAISRFASSCSALLKGGLPIASSLEISGKIVSNIVYEEILTKTADAIRSGSTISNFLAQYPDYFSPMVIQMIAVGEVSGQVDELMQKVADFYSNEVDQTAANLAEIIQPVLIVILGVFIGVFVAAVLMPIYNLAQVF